MPVNHQPKKWLTVIPGRNELDDQEKIRSLPQNRSEEYLRRAGNPLMELLLVFCPGINKVIQLKTDRPDSDPYTSEVNI
jgi:hypothetical protein